MKKTWFFDLDNTLHNASHAIFKSMDARINHFVEGRLKIDSQLADQLRHQYWVRYGSTLQGLVKHHGVTGPEYFAGTHNFDVRPLLKFERGLSHRIWRIRGKKVLLTNAPLLYSKSVMIALDLEHRFDAHIALDHMQFYGVYAPKPSRRMLLRILARRKIRPCDAVLIEDSAINLKAAKAIGMKTVLVRGFTRYAARQTEAYVPPHSSLNFGRPAYVDCCVHSVAQLHRIHWLNHPQYG